MQRKKNKEQENVHLPGSLSSHPCASLLFSRLQKCTCFNFARVPGLASSILKTKAKLQYAERIGALRKEFVQACAFITADLVGGNERDCRSRGEKRVAARRRVWIRDWSEVSGARFRAGKLESE